MMPNADSDVALSYMVDGVGQNACTMYISLLTLMAYTKRL